MKFIKSSSISNSFYQYIWYHLQSYCQEMVEDPVASLRLVLPGRQLRVSPLFFLKNLTTFFSHHHQSVLRCHPYLFSRVKLTTFLLITVTFIDFIQVSARTFLPVRPRLSTILCKFTQKIFFFARVSPPGGCHPGRSAPSP